MVWIGVGFACLLCLASGAALNAANREFPQRQQEMFEGFVALFATAIQSWKNTSIPDAAAISSFFPAFNRKGRSSARA